MRSPLARSTIRSESRNSSLPDALAGLDVLAKSPTGSGKTLAFAVPIVERTTTDDPRPSALVLVPNPRTGLAGDRGHRAAREG